jgi:hypothetical protein
VSTGATYPIRVEAHLDPGLSRWLWLVKWFLAIPHFVLLAFLWMGFAIMSVVAGFAILFTGHYPRAIFEFNVGVLRWSWRVAYYAYGALGTDRYPPFTLAEVPDYPAHLEIVYPERLSRGLVLVKWWLLAIPHYLIVVVLMGGAWLAVQNDVYAEPGLIGVLVLIAAIALGFTGRYPMGLFDLILGLNRWVLRVAAYAGLMTDDYPPFRLDMGGSEPTGTLTMPPGPGVAGTAAPTRGWTGGQLVAVVSGALLSFLALGLLTGGGVILWADRTQRDAAGFISTPAQDFTTDSFAIVAEDIELRGADGIDWAYVSDIFDEARVRVAAAGNDAIFVGIAPADSAAGYLEGVGRAETANLPGDSLVLHSGVAPDSVPAEQTFWVASTEGTGAQSLTWAVEEGTWSIVVMNADGSQGIDVSADVGAKLPILPWVAAALLGLGAILILAGIGLVGASVYRASRPLTPEAS